MRSSSRVAVAVAVAVGLSLPAAAQAPVSPTQPPVPTAAPTSAPAAQPEEPSVEERRIVAFVASGVAVASLATGITMGLLAQGQFACASDIQACNDGLQNKVVGEELFDLRAEIEQKALFADMAYLFAGAAAVVATVGFLQGFAPVAESAPAPVASLPAPVLPAPVLPVVSADSPSSTRDVVALGGK
jgi:hypothetical protein